MRFMYVRRVMVTTYLSWRKRRSSGEVSMGSLPERSNGDGNEQIDPRQSLLAALDRLPPRQRAVIVLRYFADLSEAEAARVMGCSVGSVKSHASRALTRLRTMPGLAETLTGGVS